MKTASMKNRVKRSFPLMNLTCSSCVAKSEKIIKSQEGVFDAAINLSTKSASIEYDPGVASPESIRAALRKGGYDMIIDSEDGDDGAETAERINSQKSRSIKRRTIWAIILSIPIVIIGMFFPQIPYANQIMWVLSTPVIFWLGREFFVNAWRQLKHRSANMDTLVALSTGIAYLFSAFNTMFPQFWLSRGVEPHVYFEAASVIIAFILLGRLLEQGAKDNTTSAIKKLMGLQPKTVTIIDAQGQHVERSIEEVLIGDTILVRPGERVAVDGVVSSGSSYVDESMLSGEPVALLKQSDDKVFAGTINQKGSFQFVAQKVGADTMLSQIIKMVQEAQGSKAPIQKLVDKIAGIFVPVVIVIALVTFGAWLLLDPTNGFSHGMLALVTVLIIACPCALGLATPTAIMVGIGRGAERGILIKDAESLDVAKKVDVVILDKTGTITKGEPVVTDILWLDGDDSARGVLRALEKQSEHPLADAIVSHIDADDSAISHFESITGRGVRGRVGSSVYIAGSGRLLSESGVAIDKQLADKASELEGRANSVIWFADSQNALAVIGVADQIKESSKSAIGELHAAGIDVYMLTGDIDASAKEVAAQTGIKHYRASVLPHEKAEFVKQLQSEGRVVAMVGDGINDSAALAQADLSIAMGRGSDIAIDVAKMTIVSSDLLKIPQAINLSKRTVATIHQNLFWASIYNIVAIPIAAGVLFPINGFLLNPMIAGAAMALSSVSVVANSLRLKYKKI